MKFQGYPEMENHTKQKVIFAVQEQGFAGPGVVWTAREKIHGTNFSMWTDGERFTGAKRSQFIGEGQGFYDHDVILGRYEKKIKVLRETLIQLGMIEDTTAIGVFGEYAGIMTHGKWIQTGIEYGPQDFYVFDIIVQPLHNEQYMLEDLRVEELCKIIGLKTAPLLKIGTFAEIMSIPVDLQSVVMDVNAGKEIVIRVGDTNIAEGYIAKPNVPARFRNGNRVAIKCKNDKWSETGKGRAIQATVKELSEKDKALVLDISRYITDNRLKNVLSKMDTPKTNEFGKVLGFMSKDVQKDYERDELDGASVKEAADEAGRVMRLINTEIGNLIRPNWVSICDGDW